MANVGLVTHPFNDTARELTGEITNWLLHEGHGVTLELDDDDVVPQLIIGIGGDGTMLHAAELAWNYDAPVFGVNVGRRGYLAQVEAQDWASALENFFANKFTIEPRMGLSASEVDTTPPETIDFALNDIVLEKGTPGRTITIGVAINGQDFADISCDGIIVSSATGSTGYSLSAGGPILAPKMEAIVITPVAPTTLFSRSIIIDRNGTVDLTLKGRDVGLVAYDGIVHNDCFSIGSTLHIERQSSVRFVEFGEDKFHQTIVNKFGL